jgi:hypothetical protein
MRTSPREKLVVGRNIIGLFDDGLYIFKGRHCRSPGAASLSAYINGYEIIILYEHFFSLSPKYLPGTNGVANASAAMVD